jgi:cytochrome c biogenesis protein CcdA
MCRNDKIKVFVGVGLGLLLMLAPVYLWVPNTTIRIAAVLVVLAGFLLTSETLSWMERRMNAESQKKPILRLVQKDSA